MKEQLTPKEEEALDQMIKMKERVEFLNAWEKYEQIPIPEELGELVEETIRSHSRPRIIQQKRKERKRAVQIAIRSLGSMAAALILIMIPLNTNQAFAEQMQNVPVIGRLAQVLTIRSYSYTRDSGAHVQVDVPGIVTGEGDDAYSQARSTFSETGADDSSDMQGRSVDDPAQDGGERGTEVNPLSDDSQGANPGTPSGGEDPIEPPVPNTHMNEEDQENDTGLGSQEFTDEVNEQIQIIVNEYEEEAIGRFEEYREDFFYSGGTEEEWGDRTADIVVDYEVTYQEGSVISLILTTEESWVSVYSVNYYYNLDVEEGRYLTLADLLGEDWIEICNESIRAQIEERLAEDDSLIYWGFGVDLDGEFEGFTTVDENTQFYINENGNPVVCFDKYEIAPGYMGVQEFEILIIFPSES